MELTRDDLLAAFEALLDRDISAAQVLRDANQQAAANPHSQRLARISDLAQHLRNGGSIELEQTA